MLHSTSLTRLLCCYYPCQSRASYIIVPSSMVADSHIVGVEEWIGFHRSGAARACKRCQTLLPIMFQHSIVRRLEPSKEALCYSLLNKPVLTWTRSPSLHISSKSRERVHMYSRCHKPETKSFGRKARRFPGQSTTLGNEFGELGDTKTPTA